jgi:geranylgeranyl diphosphate synthase type I
MQELFNSYKKQICKFISIYLKKKKKELNINRWSKDALNRFKESVNKGKMLRGSLVCLAYTQGKRHLPQKVVKAAVALEMFHTSLLIHDDIIDEDALRRGGLTIHTQYAQWAKQQAMKADRHFGESMGICVGDLGFFLGFDILSLLSSSFIRLIFNEYTTELTRVVLAEMEDTYFGYTTSLVSKKSILNVYRYKTAYYTFVLPLTLGSKLAQVNSKQLSQLKKLGEYLGLIFQIKDDELGIWGAEEEIGKPVGSDIREGKKTLYYLYLFKRVTSSEKKQLQHIFGNPILTQSDLG